MLLIAQPARGAAASLAFVSVVPATEAPILTTAVEIDDAVRAPSGPAAAAAVGAAAQSTAQRAAFVAQVFTGLTLGRLSDRPLGGLALAAHGLIGIAVRCAVDEGLRGLDLLCDAAGAATRRGGRGLRR